MIHENRRKKEGTMATSSPYSINLDTRYAPLELIDVRVLADAVKEP